MEQMYAKSYESQAQFVRETWGQLQVWCGCRMMQAVNCCEDQSLATIKIRRTLNSVDTICCGLPERCDYVQWFPITIMVVPCWGYALATLSHRDYQPQ